MLGEKKKNSGGLIAALVVVFLLVSAVCLYWFGELNRFGKGVAPGEKSADEIRVASININGFRTIKDPNQTAEFLLKRAKDNDIDIMFLQEYRPVSQMSSDKFKAAFAKDYPYIITDGEQAIISKFKIVDKSQTNFSRSNNSFASYLMEDASGRPFRAVSAHLQTTGFNSVRGSLSGSYGEQATTLAGTLKSNDEVRVGQAQAVREAIDASEVPVIFVGDLNSVPLSQVYRILKKGMHDAYLCKGKGKGSTYRLLKDYLRIDYIFCSKGAFSPVDFYIPEDFLSDHRMVVSTLKMK